MNWASKFVLLCSSIVKLFENINGPTTADRVKMSNEIISTHSRCEEAVNH